MLRNWVYSPPSVAVEISAQVYCTVCTSPEKCPNLLCEYHVSSSSQTITMSHQKVNSSCPSHIREDQVKNPSPKEVLTSISNLDFNPVTNSTQMIKFADSQSNKKNQTTSFEMEVMCQNITWLMWASAAHGMNESLFQ